MLNMQGKAGAKVLLAFTIVCCFGITAQNTSAANAEEMRNLAGRANFSALADEHDYDHYIVYYQEGAKEQANKTELLSHLDKIHSDIGLGIEYVRTISTGGHLIQTERKLDRRTAEDFLVAFARDSQVAYIEPDALMTIQFTPNDSSYNQQWHYFESTGGLNLPDAWDEVNGAGVTVAVIDTGIVDHFDLNANIIGGYDFISSATAARDGNGRDSNPNDEGDWFAANECGVPWSSNSSWHGSHVAGTVAAVTNNNSGVAGVAFGARIIVARTLGKCGGTISDIADAIIWSSGGSVSGVPANTNPADVINMSLGGGGSCGSTYQNAINTAVNNGTVVVVAAGNSNTNVSNSRPANCGNVIAVAANDRQGNRASYSNFGSLIDITAPGGETAVVGNGVLSTRNGGTTTQNSSDILTFFQGTSMATPHVAGLAALMINADATLTPAQIESTIKANARPLPGSCSGGCGAGIADAAETIDALTGAPPSLDVSLNCEVMGIGDLYFCTATVTGGTTPYTYQWLTNPVLSGNDRAIYASCPFGNTAAVTVTDTIGASITVYDWFPCYNGNPP